MSAAFCMEGSCHSPTFAFHCVHFYGKIATPPFCTTLCHPTTTSQQGNNIPNPKQTILAKTCAPKTTADTNSLLEKARVSGNAKSEDPRARWPTKFLLCACIFLLPLLLYNCLFLLSTISTQFEEEDGHYCCGIRRHI